MGVIARLCATLALLAALLGLVGGLAFYITAMLRYPVPLGLVTLLGVCGALGWSLPEGRR